MVHRSQSPDERGRRKDPRAPEGGEGFADVSNGVDPDQGMYDFKDDGSISDVDLSEEYAGGDHADPMDIYAPTDLGDATPSFAEVQDGDDIYEFKDDGGGGLEFADDFVRKDESDGYDLESSGEVEAPSFADVMSDDDDEYEPSSESDSGLDVSFSEDTRSAETAARQAPRPTPPAQRRPSPGARPPSRPELPSSGSPSGVAPRPTRRLPPRPSPVLAPTPRPGPRPTRRTTALGPAPGMGGEAPPGAPSRGPRPTRRTSALGPRPEARPSGLGRPPAPQGAPAPAPPSGVAPRRGTRRVQRPPMAPPEEARPSSGGMPRPAGGARPPIARSTHRIPRRPTAEPGPQDSVSSYKPRSVDRPRAASDDEDPPFLNT